MSRLLAMVAVFIAFCVLLVGMLTNFTTGEVADLTTRDSIYRGKHRTMCVASVAYTVDGQAHRSADSHKLRGLGRPIRDCPFQVGQAAIVMYQSDRPGEGIPFTTSSYQAPCTLFGALMFPVLILLAVRRS